MMTQLMRVIEKQDELIAAQGEVIDELYGLLSQHLSAAEMSGLPTVGKLNRVQEIRREVQ